MRRASTATRPTGASTRSRTPARPAGRRSAFERRRPGNRARRRGASRAAIALLRGGGILALKGLGGYQLACDALDAAAVETLRERKRRSNKAFALMAPDVDAVRAFAEVSAEEEALLLSPERPIVLLARRAGSRAPRRGGARAADLGFMLPNTPLHWLLFLVPRRASPRS